MPMTGLGDGKGSNDVLLARVNTLREEAGGARRQFISDLNGPLYILDKQTKAFTTYLNFNGRGGRPGLFPTSRSRPISPPASPASSSTQTM
jgi:hypothetical protein